MRIDERTHIPLFAVAALIPFVAAAVMWFAALYNTAAEATRINVQQDLRLDQQLNLLQDIRERIIRIEESIKHRR